MNREEGIRRVYSGPSHVVILGAGASIASSLRNPEQGGNTLPSMDNLVEVVGLDDIVQTLPHEIKSRNFEDIFSKLYEIEPESDIVQKMQSRVADYFKDMELPSEPTLYDYLVMSLRPKDIIGTFNWDPFLYDACRRNHTKARLPYVVYLHGNVRIGYCLQDMRKGLAGTNCSHCARPFTPSKLLFPIKQKNYSYDPYIKIEWNRLREALKVTQIVTIFGYSAPETDVEAIQLMSEAWGSPTERNLEQFETIDIQSEEVVRDRWNKFIHSHHYQHSFGYFESRFAYFPRRTGESFMHQFCPSTVEEALQEPNPVPQHFSTLEQMWDWFRPLIQAEEEASQRNT